MDRRRFLAAACMAGGSSAVQGGNQAALEVLSHYDYPPFLTGPGTGLSYELLDWLHSELQLSAELLLLPRRRLDMRLTESGWQGFVPWVNPIWFGDTQRRRFGWSEALMNDEDLVLHRPGLNLDYRGPESLRGLLVGGVTGHVYADIEPDVQAGRTRREDAISTELSLRKLMLGRVDVVFLSRSGLPWWAQQLPDLLKTVQIASTPRQRFQRFLLLSPHMPTRSRDILLEGVAHMHQSSRWRQILARYGLSPL